MLLSMVLLTNLSQAQQGRASIGDQAAKPKLTKPPKLVKFVEAPYLESEKAAGKQASVVLQIAISATGTVSDARVIESAGPAFDQAALEAVRAFVFEPAEIDNKPAPIRINYRYQFVFTEELPTTGVLAGVVRERGTQKPLPGVNVALDDGRIVTTDAEGASSSKRWSRAPAPCPLGSAAQDAEDGRDGRSRQARRSRVRDRLRASSSRRRGGRGRRSRDRGRGAGAREAECLDQGRRLASEEGRRHPGRRAEDRREHARRRARRRRLGPGSRLGRGPGRHSRLRRRRARAAALSLRRPALGGQLDIVRLGRAHPGWLRRGLRARARRPHHRRADGAQRKALHGSIGVDLLDASASASAPLSETTSFSIAARKSHLDWALDGLTDEDVDEFFPLPRYYDAQARLRHQLAPAASIELGGLLSSDEVTRSTASADPADRKSETEELYFDRLWLRYVSRTPKGDEIRVTPWVGRENGRIQARFGSTPTELEVRSTNFGLRASHRGRVSEYLTTTAGFDFEATSSSLHRTGSLSTPPREGDARIFGQPPSDQVNTNDWKTLQASAAPYVEADFELFDHQVHVIPGLRVGPFFASTDQRVPTDGETPAVGAHTGEVAFEPRLALRYEPNSQVAFKAAWGRYYQQTQPEELSPVFGNPLLGLMQATHWLAGASVELTKSLSAETTAFYSKSDDLPVRNPNPNPTLAEALVQDGKGRAYGAQFLVRRELADRFFGWVAYTILRSERQDAPDTAYRLFDFDQTHVLTALASYDFRCWFRARRALPLLDRLPADSRGRRLLRLALGHVSAHLGAQELRSTARLLATRRQGREDVQARPHAPRNLRRRTERHRSRQLRRGRLQPELRRETLHRRAPDLAGARRSVGVLTCAR